ncbi:MAG: Stp1/IreP family PP2C-type Ser/Thr phosphatase, partial [Proteobacteria bacterium]|nr:Stp1/IreP family PP2C-type Ser/Thr phosphatase [Pseudomonadota bacterium]
SNNEDNYLVLPEQGLFVVADGMGGHNAGEVASQIAVETLSEEARRLPELNAKRSWWRRLFRSESPFNPVQWLHDSIGEANARIFGKAQSNPEHKGMGTTVVMILKREQALLTAHVGDSRVYRYRNKKLDQLTQDHSLAQELVRQGVLTEEEALYSAPSNVLTRALGVKEDVTEEIIYHSVETGDLFLLCSDGLYNMVEDEGLTAIISQASLSLEDRVSRLIEEANTNGGKDNVTVVLASFG